MPTPGGLTGQDDAWNSGAYDRVSNPQTQWGYELLALVEPDPKGLVVDIGCGSGRVTQGLVERVPESKVVALDLYWSMITAAARLLRAHPAMLGFLQAEALALPFAGTVDLVFSTATFHWIRDHDLLFRNIYRALRRRGRLIAQCGGGPNLQRFRALCEAAMMTPQFRPWFAGFGTPWEFADPETASRRLHAAGFADVCVELFPQPVSLPDGSSYREFLEHVVCGPHLRRLPNAELRERFLSELVDRAGRDTQRYLLDYWRLNLMARKAA